MHSISTFDWKSVCVCASLLLFLGVLHLQFLVVNWISHLNWSKVRVCSVQLVSLDTFFFFFKVKTLHLDPWGTRSYDCGEVTVAEQLLSNFLCVFTVIVTWTGNLSLLAWLAISVCSEVSEVGRLSG